MKLSKIKDFWCFPWKLSKKAQMTFLRKLIIGIVFILIMMAVFMIGVFRKAEYTSWKTQCIQSVKANAALEKTSSEFAASIICPPQDESIEEDLGSAKGQNTAKARITKFMKDCWEIYGQGKLKLYTDENTFCTACAIFDFKDKNKEIDLLVRDFDYRSKISSNKEYGVIFIYAKGEDERKAFESNIEKEKNSDRIGAMIGPHKDINWNAAAVFVEYTQAELDNIGCKIMPKIQE